MSGRERTKEQGSSVEGSVKGLLTRLGDSLDAFTGRSWKPPGGLTTSHLAESLKDLIDSRIKDRGSKGRLAPNELRIKIDWQKFSAETDSLISKIEEELLIAIVDHYNDRRYHTLAPLTLRIKTDYFTDGVKISAIFPKENRADSEIELEMPEELRSNTPNTEAAPEAMDSSAPVTPHVETFHLRILGVPLGSFAEGCDLPVGSRLTIGRNGSNDVVIEDPSVSSIHASAVFNPETGFMLADLGSTNGTFLGDARLEEGIGVLIDSGTEVRFGNILVRLEFDLIHTTIDGGGE